MNAVIPSCPTHCCSDSGTQSRRSTTSTQSTQSDMLTFATKSSSESNHFNNNVVTQMPANNMDTNKNTDIKTSTLSQNDDDPYSRARYIPETANGDSNHPNTLNRGLDSEPSNIFNSTILGDLYDKVINHNFTRSPDNIDAKKRIDEEFAVKYGTVDIQNEYPKSEEIREKRETSEPNQKVSVFKSQPRKDLSKSVDSIKLIELNATIGRQYCNTLQCIQGSGPKFYYLIPLSKFMELEYVTLQFR